MPFTLNRAAASANANHLADQAFEDRGLVPLMFVGESHQHTFAGLRAPAAGYLHVGRHEPRSALCEVQPQDTFRSRRCWMTTSI
jgi:hypothetical protein